MSEPNVPCSPHSPAAEKVKLLKPLCSKCPVFEPHGFEANCTAMHGSITKARTANPMAHAPWGRSCCLQPESDRSPRKTACFQFIASFPEATAYPYVRTTTTTTTREHAKHPNNGKHSECTKPIPLHQHIPTRMPHNDLDATLAPVDWNWCLSLSKFVFLKSAARFGCPRN